MRARFWTVLAAGPLAGIDRRPVSPAASVESGPLDIRVRGLAPHERVTVALRSTDARGYTWGRHEAIRSSAAGRSAAEQLAARLDRALRTTSGK